MLKTTLFASAIAGLILLPADAFAGDRSHWGHHVRQPRLVIVLPHRDPIVHHHLRAWHRKPWIWYAPAPRHGHVWKATPPRHAHWQRGERDRRRGDGHHRFRGRH